MLATENVKRQITEVAVIAMKEAPQMIAMNRIVRGVYVQDNLPRRPLALMRLNKQISE